jgi:hypothetical protein
VKTVIFIIISSLAIMSCSSKPPKPDTATVGKSEYDTDKPTSYAEYKKWRQENDPASEAYARYKEWQINYRRWKLEQEK